MTGLTGNWPDHTIPGRVRGSCPHLQVISEKLAAEDPEMGPAACTPALTLDALATKLEWATNKTLLTKARPLSGHSYLSTSTPNPCSSTQWLPTTFRRKLRVSDGSQGPVSDSQLSQSCLLCHNLFTQDSISYTHTPRPLCLCICCLLCWAATTHNAPPQTFKNLRSLSLHTPF